MLNATTSDFNLNRSLPTNPVLVLHQRKATLWQHKLGLSTGCRHIFLIFSFGLFINSLSISESVFAIY